MTEWWHLSPAFLLLAFIPLILFLPAALLRITLAAAPLYAIAFIWLLPRGLHVELANLQWLMVGPCSRLFGTAFCIALWGSGMLAWQRLPRTELAAGYFYAASALGIVFSGDLPSLLIWWEMLAIGAVIILWSSGTKAARAAAMRYAFLHLIGGMAMIGGISLYMVMHETYAIAPFAINDWHQLLTHEHLPEALILIGILVNLGAPPFSSWVADSYPEASPSGTALLSAITTKSAVFVAIMLFGGLDILIPIGLFMVFYGIVMAMLENDARRILSYSIVNQVGFMVAAIGIGTPLALLGAAAHAFCHIIYKGLLMMSAGVVLEATGKRRCSELGGLYHSMPFTTLCASIGALAISAMPLTSGFVSKGLAIQAAADQQLFWVWMALIAASAGVFLHAGIKYPWFVFFQKDSGLRPAEAPWPSRIGMGVFALLCILPGIWPEGLYRMLPLPPYGYEAYTASHVLPQLELLCFSALAFFLLLPWLGRTLTLTLDWDWFIRRPGRMLWQRLEHLVTTAYRDLSGIFHAGYGNGWNCRGCRLFSQTITSGSLLCLLLVMLSLCMLVYFWA
ncbi:Na+/H+ antiporter subunit D [bacterium]|nr:Na+/H+ antiporter subunit D [bacterium]